MGKAIDLTGQRFGKLVALRRTGLNKHKQALWECRCDCGNVKVVVSATLKESKSCGCERYGNSRQISDETLAVIVKMRAMGKSTTEIARVTGVSQSHISHICIGRMRYAKPTQKGVAFLAEIRRLSLRATRKLWKQGGSRSIAVMLVAPSEGNRNFDALLPAKIDRSWFDTLAKTRWFIRHGQVTAYDAARHDYRAILRIKGAETKRVECKNGDPLDLRRDNWEFINPVPTIGPFAEWQVKKQYKKESERPAIMGKEKRTINGQEVWVTICAPASANREYAHEFVSFGAADDKTSDIAISQHNGCDSFYDEK